MINGQAMMMEEYINRQVPYIESMQKTNKSKERGRWLLACTRANIPLMFKCVDYVLPQIF
eukprot:3626138-Ditylum_brightwellii.AAC.1